MLFESQWLECREQTLALPDLPPALEGLTVLHMSDAHVGQPGLNLRTLGKAVAWAQERRPDLVVLTGDMLGTGRAADRCLNQLSRLRPLLGMFAVPGNHEYGLSKNPLTRGGAMPAWESAGVTLLRDRCLTMPVTTSRGQAELTICGADYLTGGHGLEVKEADNPESPRLAMLLIHRPPAPDDVLGARFDLAFAGHTHGGQIRVPTPAGLKLVHAESLPYVSGVHPWGRGSLVISRGIGTTFVPFRLCTRPEVVLYRLVRRPGGRS